MARRYLSPDKAAERLGWVGGERGRRLVRILLAKERALGREIMVRTGGKLRQHYLLTMPMLQHYCRELFLRTPDELVDRLTPALRNLEDRVEAIVDERVGPQLEELRVADDIQSRAIQRVELRVARLEQGKS